MDFSFTEEQKMFHTMVRDFATQHLEPLAAEIDETEEFPAGSVKTMAELGLFGVGIKEEYGGSGGDAIGLALATEEIARACAATSAVYLASLSLACHPIYHFGSEEQKQRWVRPLAQGTKLGAFGLTETGAGSDPAALETTARRDGDDYILNGTKIFITNGAEADILSVFATTDRSLKHKGLLGLVVEKGTPGFSVGKKEKKLGIKASSTAELIFDDCRVPVANRL